MPGTEHGREDRTRQWPVGQGHGLGTVSVISGLMTCPTYSTQSQLGQVPSLSQVFQSISEWTREDEEPGQHLLLPTAGQRLPTYQGSKPFLLQPLTHVIILFLWDPLKESHS